MIPWFGTAAVTLTAHQPRILGSPFPPFLGLVGLARAGPGWALLWFFLRRPQAGNLRVSGPGQAPGGLLRLACPVAREKFLEP